MAVYTIDRPSLNAQVGAACRQLDATFQHLAALKSFTDTVPDASLISLYGYVQADIDIIRSALSDAAQLQSLYQGGATLAVAKDFRTFAKQTYPYGSV